MCIRVQRFYQLGSPNLLTVAKFTSKKTPLWKTFFLFLSPFVRGCTKVWINCWYAQKKMGTKRRRILCWFRNRWKSWKKSYKQVINKNETEMCTFYTFDHMFIGFVCLQLFWCILALLPNFEAKCARNGSKNLKTYFVNVSKNLILLPSQGQSFLFSLKKSNSLYPSVHPCRCSGRKS